MKMDGFVDHVTVWGECENSIMFSVFASLTYFSYGLFANNGAHSRLGTAKDRRPTTTLSI